MLMGVFAMEIFEIYHINFIFRIIISCFCGIAIGFERKNRAKEAGVRTHCIVACASALMMIISKYGFFDIIQSSLTGGADVRLDPSRLAQGIVTGVGFLGAGMIYIQRGSIRGLTTASGIWATCGIGMALGAGMYVVGISSTVIILIVQFTLHNKKQFMIQHKIRSLVLYGVNEEDFQKHVCEILNEKGISINEVSISGNVDNTYDYTFFLDMPENIPEEQIIKLFSYRTKIDILH